MHGEDNQLRVGIRLFQTARSFDAIQAGHGNVQQYHIGAVSFGGFQHCPAIAGRGHHLEFRGEKSLQPFEEDGMVVGKQQPRLLHGLLDSVATTAGCISRGIRISILVPSPGVGEIEKVPPMCRTRSSMLINPSPFPLASPKSNPCPSSRMATCRASSIAGDRNLCSLRPGMFADVPQGLLDHTIHA